MGKKILIVDDEKDFTELIGTLLSFHNLSVDTVNDPTQVDAAVHKANYDLIVTDLMMPSVDGFELIRRLRADGRYASAPLIVLSAKILSDQERKFLFQNKVHVLTKPFEPQGLVDQISELLVEPKKRS